VSRAYTYSNHVVWILGKKSWPWLCQGEGQDFSLKAKAKEGLLPRPEVPRPRPHEVSSRILEAKPGLEDNKTDYTKLYSSIMKAETLA